MKLARRDNAAWVGRPPENWLTFFVPRKDAGTIGGKKSFVAQVTAGGQQAIGFSQCEFDRWKCFHWICWA